MPLNCNCSFSNIFGKINTIKRNDIITFEELQTFNIHINSNGCFKGIKQDEISSIRIKPFHNLNDISRFEDPSNPEIVVMGKGGRGLSTNKVFEQVIL